MIYNDRRHHLLPVDVRCPVLAVTVILSGDGESCGTAVEMAGTLTVACLRGSLRHTGDRHHSLSAPQPIH
jgi:acetamidase/formamidase